MAMRRSHLLGGSPVLGSRAGLPVRALLCGCLLAAAVAADTEPKLTFVDLQPKTNQDLTDGMHGAEENNLQNVPQGEQKMADTRFMIGKRLIHVRGQNAPELPGRVEDIKIDATFDRLHILHSTGYGEGQMQQNEGTEIGAYIVRYEDKGSATIPIRYGEHLRDWWNHQNRDYTVTRAKIAWKGKNPISENADRDIHLFAMVWDNPHPDRKVTAIDFVSYETLCDPFLLALTLEKKLRRQT